jgi:predicted ATPase/DNA-binding XRE family transcriptional regulator
LRRFRYAAGLSQELLAERARISPETIGALERGVRSAPQRETLALLIEGLTLTGAQREEFEAAAAASRRVGRPRLGAFVPDVAVQPAAAGANPQVPNNLPHAVNSFQGRERELAELRQQLRGRRLVTLLGAGGSGKTRLALEVAREHLGGEVFPDGIWLVDLVPLADPDLVTPTIARILRVAGASDQSPLEALAQALRDMRLLLILDNCDHLLESCAAVVQRLTSACDGVSVLATSREALDLDGELRYQIDPLPLLVAEIEGSGAESLDRWRASPAVRLFLDRAEEADPRDFPAAAAGDPIAVARICARLDGLPLALELAAARTQDLSLREIEDGLEARFALLARGRRAAAPRHQTLRGMFDWSYALLTERDQSLFRRLAIFAGPWTAQAAVAICGDDGSGDEAAIRSGVASLVSKSLLVVERRERESARYRLLESTRAYARELLEESGEREALSQRHAQYYRSRLQRAHASWLANFGVAAVDAFDTLVAEFHEVEAALGWAIGEQRDLSLGGELVEVLIDVWLECCVGTGTTHDEPVAPPEHGIVYLLSVLQPSDVRKTAKSSNALPARGHTVDPLTDWLASFKTRRSYRAGEVIFRKGDAADELLYILSGVVSLNEIDVQAGRHELLGEIAFFSPRKQRTATATCSTDVSVQAIDRRDMLDLYEQNAAFRLHVIAVVTSRLIEDLERLRNVRVPAEAPPNSYG